MFKYNARKEPTKFSYPVALEACVRVFCTNKKIIARRTTANESGNIASMKRADWRLKRRCNVRSTVLNCKNSCSNEIRDSYNYLNSTAESYSGDVRNL